jgi:hypothetical protein
MVLGALFGYAGGGEQLPFSAQISTVVIDLRRPPFDGDAAVWMHPTDYAATQALAQTAREAHVGGIQYQSVRDSRPAWCMAVLVPHAFAHPKPYALTQSWWLSVHQDVVVWRRENESITFDALTWV